MIKYKAEIYLKVKVNQSKMIILIYKNRKLFYKILKVKIKLYILVNDFKLLLKCFHHKG